MIYHGTLFGWYETGTEGVHWALEIDGKSGYSALKVIEEDDWLKIYDDDGKVIFDGVIEKDTQIGYQSYPLDSQYGHQQALGFWIHWVQKGWLPDEWAALFLRSELGKKQLRGELVKK